MLEHIKPWIMLQDNTKIPMSLSKIDGNVYYFVDDKGRAELKLVIKESGSIKAVLVDGRVKPAKYQYSDVNYLNSECAIGLEIQSIGDIKGYMADYLHHEFWCEPYIGTDITRIPKDTQALLWEKKDGIFGFMLPVCDEKYKCTINGSENGLTIKLFSWYYLNEKVNSSYPKKYRI